MSLSLLQSYESDSSVEDEAAHHSEVVETSTEPQEASNLSSILATPKSSSQQPEQTVGNKKPGTHNSHQREKKSTTDIPPDLARELKAAGHDSSTIDILEIDPTPIANQPHPSSHIPQHALRNNAMRLARHITKESVSTVARRKHQITALAAEAVALQVAHDTLPGAVRPGSRIHGKFK